MAHYLDHKNNLTAKRGFSKHKQRTVLSVETISAITGLTHKEIVRFLESNELKVNNKYRAPSLSTREIQGRDRMN